MTVYINGVADIGDMLKATYDPNEDGLIALAQLVAAVCSETEAKGFYHPGLKPDLVRWVIPGWVGIASVAGLLVDANKIYYTPIFVSETTTYIRIGIEVETEAEGTADLRIFNWNGGLPSSLVLSAGTVDIGTPGLKEIIIAQELTPGYYFLAIRCTGAPVLDYLDAAKAISPPVTTLCKTGYPNISNGIMTVTAEYADPAPAPTDIVALSFCFVVLREN